MRKKYIIFLYSFLAIGIWACEKGPDPVTYFMKATVNGTVTEYSYPAYSDTIKGPGFVSTVISGTQGGSTNVVTFTFRSNSSALLVPGTYTGTNTYTLTATIAMGVINKTYTNTGNANFTVIVDAVNGTYAEGRFSGTLKEISNQLDILTIADGSFKAAFIP